MTADDALFRLRLAAALAHSLPLGWVEAELDDGRVLRAAYERGDPPRMTPCEFRAMLLARSCTALPMLLRQLREVRVGGAVADAGGGLYTGCDEHGRPAAWFATLLAPATVGTLIGECELEVEGVCASIRPDEALGAVVVWLFPDDAEADATDNRANERSPVGLAQIEAVGRVLTAACFTQELLYSSRSLGV